jgi:hypothetical protein
LETRHSDISHARAATMVCGAAHLSFQRPSRVPRGCQQENGRGRMRTGLVWSPCLPYRFTAVVRPSNGGISNDDRCWVSTSVIRRQVNAFHSRNLSFNQSSWGKCRPETEASVDAVSSCHSIDYHPNFECKLRSSNQRSHLRILEIALKGSTCLVESAMEMMQILPVAIQSTCL